MKIAIFSDCYLDLPGGIPAVINAEKAELEKRGHTVYVFSSAYPRSQEEIAKLAQQNIFPVPSCRVILRGITPVARRPKIIENWLLKTHPELKDFDIFYVHYEAGCSIAGLRLAKKLKIPAVQVMHGREDVGEAGMIPFGFRTFIASALNLFHSWYLPHPVKIHRDNYLAKTLAAAKMWTLMVNHANFADLVITPSDHFAKKLKHYGVTKKIIALHHGLPDELCDAPRLVRELRPGEPLKLIWHSRVSGEKRIMPFLRAMNMTGGGAGGTPAESAGDVGGTATTGPVSILHVYGDGNQLKKAQKYAKRHGLSVTFHGQVPFEKLYAEIANSHLDVLVSYDFDTFGMSLIEAESAGTPVFIADPDLAESVPENSYILSQNPTPEAMAEALKNLYEHPENLAEMSKNMLKNRENIKISRKIDQLEQIFAKTIDKSS